MPLPETTDTKVAMLESLIGSFRMHNCGMPFTTSLNSGDVVELLKECATDLRNKREANAH